MQPYYSRTAMLIGEAGIARLKNARVALFGLGGVGSFTAEALARAGVGQLLLVDDDVIAPSNLNRQIFALESTIGQPKALVAKRRIGDINPSIAVDARVMRYEAITADAFDFEGFDYIVDAIDSVTSKLLLIQRAREAGVPILCCMGTGNKLDPMAFRVGDIEETRGCPLARVMRRELRKRGIESVRVVWSPEPPKPAIGELEETAPGRRALPGSISFVPAAAGLLCAAEAVRCILNKT